MYVPEVRGRVEEGARKYEYRLEELERAQENATHVPSRWRQIPTVVVDTARGCRADGSAVRDFPGRSAFRPGDRSAVELRFQLSTHPISNASAIRRYERTRCSKL